MADLELDGVTKVYREDDGGEVVAVDDVSLTVADGDFLVLVGPSGCGKSTTLRMIAGLESVTSGDIRLGGRSITDVRPADRNIAMVFQSYALYPHMTVRENMAFGLQQSTEMPAAEITETVEETARTIGIEELLERKPEDLSGGQRQRVALGRAIVRDPEVFLMDEPLSNLDAKLRARMRTELQRLQEDLGVTTVYVTHDQTEAMTMGDRIAILDAGRLQQVAAPLECYHRPANLFVAGFLGEPSMNTLTCEVEGDQLACEWFDYPLTEAMQTAIEGTGDDPFGDDLDDDSDDPSESVGDGVDRDRNDDVVLGVRPEAVRIKETAEEAYDVTATVDVVEPTGDANTVYLQFADDGGPGSGHDGATLDVAEQASALVVTTDGSVGLQSGQTVVARIPPDAVHLFDAATGASLHHRSVDDIEGVDQPVPE